MLVLHLYLFLKLEWRLNKILYMYDLILNNNGCLETFNNPNPNG